MAELITLFGFVLGTILGSLALALAQRSLTDKTFFGRSHCPSCNHTLSSLDLIPLFSYLYLKGRCRYCQKKIPREYFLVELIVGLLIGLLFFLSVPAIFQITTQAQGINFILELIAKIFVITVLVIVAITDYKQTLIPDRITYPAIKIIFIWLLLMAIYLVWAFYTELNGSPIGNYLIYKTDYFLRHSLIIAMPLFSGLIMAAIIGLFFLSLIIITRGRGMGGGDLKLGILLGLFLGYPLSMISILLSFLIGSVVAIGLILGGKKHFGQTIPFGPFLSLGGIITILWSAQIINYYSNLNLTSLSFPALFMLK